MTELLASLVFWLGLAPASPAPLPYDCTTDLDCQVQCEARGESRCDDMMYEED